MFKQSKPTSFIYLPDVQTTSRQEFVHLRLFCLDQSWAVLVSQTDVLGHLMKKCSEDLLDGPISKLTLLIRDKQQLRKTYTEQWNLLRQELSKVRDDVTPVSL